MEDKKFQSNPIADVRTIRSQHQEALHVEMEYLMPYTRLKSTAVSSTGMQITNVKKNEPEPVSDVHNVAVSSKTIQKHVLNQQFKQLKGSSEAEFSPTKMSKKQLKVAQDQLKKLTKINIHLHGKYGAMFNFRFMKFDQLEF